MVLHTELSVLKIKEGKFVTVQKINSIMKLCAVEKQNEGEEAPLVHIWRRENQMALRFLYEDDYYFPKVDGTTLELEKAAGGDTPDNTSDSHWFEKENLGCGEHYGLRSVVHPRQYLSIKKKPSIFILSQTRQECVEVTDKKIG